MNRTPRKVEVADPLWHALETMSREMGVDRDVLVNQAIFALARQFGFIQPTPVSLSEMTAPASNTVAAPAVTAAPAVVAHSVVPVQQVAPAQPTGPAATPVVPAEAPARPVEVAAEKPASLDEVAGAVPSESAEAEPPVESKGEEAEPTTQESQVDDAALREAVSARILTLVADVDRLVEPVSEEEDDSEDEEESDAEDSDDEDDSADDEDSDESEDEADSDDADDEDSDESEDEAGSDDADDEDSDDADEEDSDGADSDDDADESEDDEAVAARGAGGAADDEDSDANEPDTLDNVKAEPLDDGAASAPPVDAHSDVEDEDASDVVTQAKDDKRSGPRPDKTIIVPKPPEMTAYVKLDDGEPILVNRERFIIGRGPNCDLMVKSARVSREHAAILREGEELFIEDLRSSNGTWFDNNRITRQKVSDGDEFLLGGIRITFSLS
ncbi:FHA domain-containing protein [Myxococcus sp. K15C18031901]|uniref:FHA domain-containing protein n=1 Tax=Myxococcus dinghuensis TaxID=2906761 RepID=UPI0020A6EB16|nr:FHA domain-containing protein [Myxococcus dinghuensis]MCP3103217.1 FHA domain-containing protein [Myxococcus dinghuensis]